MELSEAVFGIEPNEAVMHDVVKNYLANQRQGTQSALTRARGFRRRQESRGDRRAPATPARVPPVLPSGRHGGIVFAPKPRGLPLHPQQEGKPPGYEVALSPPRCADNEMIVLDAHHCWTSIRPRPSPTMLKAVGAEKKALIVLPEYGREGHRFRRQHPRRKDRPWSTP